MNVEMQDLIEEMKSLFQKIQTGKASVGEIEAFSAAASQVHERAVVLRYKAYEAKVFGTEITAEAVAVVEDLQDDGKINSSFSEEEAKEHLSFDFQLEEAEEQSLGFDLFQGENKASLLAKENIEDKNETPIHTKEDATVESIRDNTDTEISFTQEKEIHEEAHSNQSDKLVEIEEVKNTKSDEAQPMSANSDLHPIYGKLPQDMNSLSARILSVRLDSLKGAFGFNERVLIIQELFNGSSEDFSSALDEIDSIQQKPTARTRVSELAYKNDWKLDSEVAIDFIQKVERKFA
jgi:hypothetical protein